MVIDTSALVAILSDEPECAAFAEAIERDPNRLISAVSVVEASLVLESRYGENAVNDLDLLLAKTGRGSSRVWLTISPAQTFRKPM